MGEEETTTQPTLEPQPPLESPPIYPGGDGGGGYPPQEPGAVDLGALMRGRKGEKLDLGSAYLLRAMMREDRADKRLDMEWQDRQDRKDKKPVDIGKVVGDAVQTAVSGVMAGIKPLLPNENAKSSEEMPGWAKSLEDQNKTILKRFETEDQEKHDRKLIEEATGSLKQQIGDLQSQLNTVTTSKETSEPKGILDGYLKTRNQLKEAGLLQENPPGTIKLGDEGIPVSGSVPAWVVYGPKVADDVLAAAEKRIDGIISKIMLLGATDKGKKVEGKDIIEIPPKPIPPKGYPPLKPAKPPEETKKEEPPKKEPELVEIPPKPPKIETPPQPPKETKPETEKIESIDYKRGLPSKPEVVKVTSKEEVSKTTQLEETKIGSETMQPTGTTKETEVEAVIEQPTATKEVEIEQTESTDEVEVVTIPDSKYPTVEPVEASIPPYTRQGLEEMKMTNLWQIANKLGTSRSGKKEELIGRILEASEKVKINVKGKGEDKSENNIAGD